MGRVAEMWQDEQESAEQQQDTLAEELFQLGCAMNAARLEEIERDMPADDLRKANRENAK